MALAWTKDNTTYRAACPGGGEYAIVPVTGHYGRNIDHWALYRLEHPGHNPEGPVSRHTSLKRAKIAAEKLLSE